MQAVNESSATVLASLSQSVSQSSQSVLFCSLAAMGDVPVVASLPRTLHLAIPFWRHHNQRHPLYDRASSEMGGRLSGNSMIIIKAGHTKMSILIVLLLLLPAAARAMQVNSRTIRDSQRTAANFKGRCDYSDVTNCHLLPRKRQIPSDCLNPSPPIPFL